MRGRHALAACTLLLVASSAVAAPGASKVLGRVGFEARMSQQVPRSAKFRDAAGHRIELGDYFGRVPIVLALVYYRCKNLCSVVLSDTVAALSKIGLEAGKDFEVAVVSIDPREDPALASQQKREFLARYAHPGTGEGWHFLTGSAAASRAVADAIGFRYFYDAEHDQYAHPAGITILTPAGRVSRVFYGVAYAPRELRLGIVEAAKGAVGSIGDQLLLLCYHYDPTKGRYGLLIMNVIRLAAAVTLAALGAGVGLWLWREHAGAGDV